MRLKLCLSCLHLNAEGHQKCINCGRDNMIVIVVAIAVDKPKDKV